MQSSRTTEQKTGYLSTLLHKECKLNCTAMCGLDAYDTGGDILIAKRLLGLLIGCLWYAWAGIKNKVCSHSLVLQHLKDFG